MLINAYKPVGKTPLEVVKKVKEANPELKNKKIGYAGRLDPMAEGVLLLMVGKETKNRDQYQNLEKEYQFEILFGVETDTLDILGLISHTDKPLINKNTLEKCLKKLKGEIKLPYPAYSSKTVDGKPLFWWARNNKLNEIDIPVKRSEIKSIHLTEVRNIRSTELKNYVFDNIGKIDGDFRQKKIHESWSKFFDKTATKSFKSALITTKVSSGTYVRSLCKNIANDLNTIGIALKITRLSVGQFTLKNSNNFFDQYG